MSSLGEFCSTDSRLPWFWIIEYLAGFQQVETSILHELVEMAPELPEELAKNTREMVALRCLEDLFGAGNGETNDGLSDMEEKTGFALSESCEDVLQCILQEASTSDLKMAGPELLKWNVRPFIMQKRASMPKSALQQLKDTILEGSNPLASSLMESSGLMCVNERGRILTDDVYHNARTCRVDRTGNDAQAIGTDENVILRSCENGNKLSEDNSHNTNLLPSKRTRNESNDLAAEYLLGHSNELQGEFNLHSSAKKLKQNAVCADQSMEQISVPLHHRELLEHLPERVVEVTEGECCDFANQSQDAVMEDSQFPEDVCDQCPDTKRLGQNADIDDDGFEHNQTVVRNIINKMPQETSGDEPVGTVSIPVAEVSVTELRMSCDAPSHGTRQKDSADESKGQAECFFEEEMLSDNDEYHNEKIDAAKKKSHFLSSRCLLDKDSLAETGCTEQNLCVKCNKDGHLLVCDTSSCRLVVHENCLVSPAKFDKNGNFYCPFCAYMLAISEYLEAKRKASLARKELHMFMHLGFEQHPEEHAERLQRKDLSHSRQNEEEEIYENGHLGGQEHNRVEQNGPHVHDISDCPCEESSGNPRTDIDKIPCRNTDDAHVDQREAEGGIDKEDLQQENSNLSEKPVFALDIDGEDTSETENDKFIISNYYIRFRRRERKLEYPGTPQLRRKKVPWMAKEEEMLKKGVQKFTSVDERNIPWKKILEFGSCVFSSVRTAMDLKDKWRNMCKGSPKTK